MKPSSLLVNKLKAEKTKGYEPGSGFIEGNITVQSTKENMMKVRRPVFAWVAQGEATKKDYVFQN